ncbi:dihydroneopterin aldolase [Streptomyces sp. 4N509B]|uniref:dihydroneopterin aldolase n=1 Tax=Streptomyces sp. 4N509B TaxID=3457413 RepID=UPI003FD6A37C
MVDRITLRGVRARGFHGALPEERALGQTFVVDVELLVDTRPAAATDDLSLTVHYGVLAEEVVAVVEGEPCQLLETLAQRVADRCLAHPVVREATVTVHKPQAPITVPFDDVAVTITRGRPSSPEVDEAGPRTSHRSRA